MSDHELTCGEWVEFEQAVRSAAADVAANWLNTVEADEIEQDVMVRLLESPGSLRKLANEDPKTRRNFLRTIATQVASAQVEEYAHFSGQHVYDVSEVRDLLESGVFEEEPTTFEAERLDLYEALLNMIEHHSVFVDVLTDRYSAGGVPPENGSAERKQLNRAVRELTTRMNRIAADRRREYRDGPGSRAVVSNSSARYSTGD